MFSLRGALEHHNFEVLSHGVHQKVVLQFADRPYVIPDALQGFVPQIQAYWAQKKPALQNFPSIVSVRSISVGTEPGETGEEGVNLLKIRCKAATYLQFIHTNLSLGLIPDIHELMATDQSIGDLEFRSYPADSVYRFPRFANSLGISVAVTTADNQFVVCKRFTSPHIAHDEGKWQCAIGTQVKRHEERFLKNGVPCVYTSAAEGIRDELGDEITKTCSNLRCTGLVLVHAYMHPELLFHVSSTLTGSNLLQTYATSKVAHRDEVQKIKLIDVTQPGELLHFLKRNWSTQHVACAMYALAETFPDKVQEAGLLF